MAEIYRGDDAVVSAVLMDNGAARDITGATITTRWVDPTGVVTAPTGSIVTAAAGSVKIVLTDTQTLALAIGLHGVQFIVTLAGDVQTYPGPNQARLFVRVSDK